MKVIRIAAAAATLWMMSARPSYAGPVEACAANCAASHETCLLSANSDEQRAACDERHAQCEARCASMKPAPAMPR